MGRSSVEATNACLMRIARAEGLPLCRAPETLVDLVTVFALVLFVVCLWAVAAGRGLAPVVDVDLALDGSPGGEEVFWVSDD